MPVSDVLPLEAACSVTGNRSARWTHDEPAYQILAKSDEALLVIQYIFGLLSEGPNLQRVLTCMARTVPTLGRK